ncbi:acyl-CoA dehydrogenase (plasmid) [Sphingomonas paeninsulae]|jgi:alkylation response protein AidB-like acyl-CoA dehydrogenase|uniref:Acyl-CoA dehydrogenase n=1 Tax=Sphingomonas paeninsulae TaxID=2319844 RepID=A0A494T7P9_SPHPE|nr:acyl-CoA dehydrogenase family protein [Sphingomonas paeninsulae]AYJ85379.1 acyl-CoA dehydrogenase [Sphingomonas paeninsulae]
MDIDYSTSEMHFREEVRAWLAVNTPKEPRPFDGTEGRAFDLAWQRRQYDGGWAGINWPTEYGGRGLSLIEQIIWFEEYARAGAPFIGVCFVGVNHGGPTLIARGSEDQKHYHLPRILKAETIWCQGFSEPGAGSDLAGIRTHARIDGDELVINGSKIWTSYADLADWQELLVRTDPNAERHKGLSWVICDMRTPGITVRPIRLMSGQIDLCEVFYDEVRVPVENIVGGIDQGWSVAMSTLGFERGTGFIAEQVSLAAHVEQLIGRARETTGTDGRALIASERLADDLATLRAEVTALKAMTYRTVSEVARTGTPGAEASIVRLYTSELSQRVARCEIGMMGQTMLDFSYGMKDPTHRYLYGFAQTIAGGSAQIQRNIIGERVLGLPK